MLGGCELGIICSGRVVAHLKVAILALHMWEATKQNQKISHNVLPTAPRICKGLSEHKT